MDEEDTKIIKSKFDKFYIATYNIGEDYRISEVSIWLPNPENNKAYLISDLTSYIGTKTSHHFEIEQDLKDVLTQTIAAEGIVDAAAFGIVIDDVEEQGS